ncbi:hypothetical protein ACI2JA_16310 [Alkalihalobacillus sp. NPDC078783]
MSENSAKCVRWFLFVFLIILIMSVCPSWAEAKAGGTPIREQLIIIVPGMSFDEAEWFLGHGDRALWSSAYIGAMNTKSAGLHSELGSVLTLSAGRKTMAIPHTASYDSEEELEGQRAKDQFIQFTDHPVVDGIVYPQIEALHKVNQDTHYKARVGQIGDRLFATGIRAFVLGTSDTDQKHRFGSFLTMNSKGTTDGSLNESVIQDTTRAYGKKMNSGWMIDEIAKQSKEYPFIVVEWGDLYRLFALKNQMTDVAYEKQREQALGELEAFILSVQEEHPDMWLISPFVHKEAYSDKKQLAPIYEWTSNGVGGALVSDTTRRTDVLSNVDVAPTLIQRIGLPSTDYDQGFPLKRIIKEPNHSQQLLERVDQSVHIFKTRAWVLSIYVTSLAILLLGVSGWTWLGKKKETQKTCLETLLLSALSSPLWFLLLARLESTISAVGFFLLILCCSLLWGGSVRLLRSWGILLTALVTVLALSADILTGSTLLSHSYLGYDPLIGARYYGIGNEYVGIYIIFIFVITVYLANTRITWLRWTSSTVLIAGQLLVLGHSQLGANAGGFLSACLASFFWFMWASGSKVTKKKIILSLIVSGVGSLILLYVLQAANHSSHIGVAYGRIQAGDFSYIADTIARKVEMNIKLFKHSNWTQLLVISYLLAGLILLLRLDRWRDVNKQVFIKIGVLGSVILLLINDSGVVAAATSMFCVVSIYFYWRQIEQIDY